MKGQWVTGIIMNHSLGTSTDRSVSTGNKSDNEQEQHLVLSGVRAG